ncbi:hypothetical protein HDU67_007253 [Dinochytrium kinnereticum]|nr:hypothetical protein HDU67_007253 [Dinochytrium kinnereticum]
MINPSYQDYNPHRLPKLTLTYPTTKKHVLSSSPKSWVNIISGEAHGFKGPVETPVPTSYLHYILQPGSKIASHVPAAGDWNCFCYVVKGVGVFGESVEGEEEGGAEVGEGGMVVFERKVGLEDGKRSAIVVRNGGKAELSVLVIGGRPLDEPVARRGPFVMNTEEEIQQAFKDYASGKMGTLRPEIKH